jgi:hypothetical protein
LNITEPQLFNVVVSLVGAILVYLVISIRGLRSEVRSDFSETRATLNQLAQDVAFIRGQLAPRPEQVRRAEG